MKTIFFLNASISFLIFVLIAIAYLKHYKSEKTNKIINYLSVIGLFYLFISILSFLWLFEFLQYSPADFLWVYAFVVIIQTIIIFLIGCALSGKKRNYLFILVYLILIILFSIINYELPKIVLLLSFMFILLFFLGINFNKDAYRTLSYLGIFYSLVSIIFQIFLIIKRGEGYVFALFSNLVFLILIIFFIKDLKSLSSRDVYPKKTNYLISFLRYFTFIIVLSNLVFISTIGVHEVGHFLVAKFYSCGYNSIVYDGLLPHTEILCESESIKIFATLGGIGLPLIIFFFLYLIGGKFLKDLAMLILGFDSLISSKDFVDLGLSQNLSLALSFFGLICVILGIVMLARSRIEEHSHLLF